MVTAETITDALLKLPNLKEFLVSEALEDDLGPQVLATLFNKLPFLEAADFCGASSDSFLAAMSKLQYTDSTCQISRLSFHQCVSLPASVFENLLPRLGELTRLDLTHTHVSARALMSIPATARITHLSLSKCRSIGVKSMISFLTTHPAVASGSLQWLSLQWADLSPDDLSTLLKSLQSSSPHLFNLNLYGLPVEKYHLDFIPHTVEELSLGFASLSVDDLIAAFSSRTNLRYLDLTGNPYITCWTIGEMRLLKGIPSVQTWEFDLTKILLKMTHVRLPNYTIVIGQGRRGWIFCGEKNKDALHVAHCASRAVARCQYVLGMDIGSTPAWDGASRKIDCSAADFGAGLERGIYLYYAYRIC